MFRILDVDNHAPYTDALTIHLVQLPRVHEARAEANRAPDDALLRWGRFFAARTAEELDEAAMSDSAVSKARDTLLRLSADPDVRAVAEAREGAQLTRRIEDGGFFEQGRREGREEGRRERIDAALQSERRLMVGTLCEVMGILLDEQREAQVTAMDADALAALIDMLRTTRAWPSDKQA